MSEVEATMSNTRERKRDKAFLSQLSDMVTKLSFNPRRTSEELAHYQPFADVPNAPARAIPLWTDQESEPAFPDSSPARNITLESPDGSSIALEEIAGDTTLLLVVDQPMTLLPGLSHRIHRRSETLGFGVRLVCISNQPGTDLDIAYSDPSRKIETLAGGFKAPFLLSLDRRGHVFDIVTDSDAIMHWLWNDPRPHSLRANGAVSLDDLVG